MFNLDVGGFFDVLKNLWDSFVQLALSALPLSPVSSYLEYFVSLPYLGYINWFIPIGTCVKIMSAWIGCITAYYVLSAILRWAKLIA